MRAAQFRLQALLASMVAIWCGNFIALKLCLQVMSPVGVTAFRVVAAAALLYLIQRYSPGRYAFRKLRKSDYWLFLKLAFVGLLLNQVLFISGLKFTTVAHSALVVTFGPLFTLLFAWRRGQESLTGTNLFGMALSICGILFLNLDKNLNLQTVYLVGDLLTLGGSVTFAYYTVMSKNVAAQYGAVSATAFTYLAGACVFLPVGLPALVTLPWLVLPWGVLVAFFYVAVLSSVLAPLIFYYALRHISASRLAALTYLQPVLTTISSVLILSEKLTLNFIFGGSIVLAGILLTQRSTQGRATLGKSQAQANAGMPGKS
jgi:drug/metabolite transporter (DMT)-like permease